jgi:hypothetical protein
MRELKLLITTELPPGEGSGFFKVHQLGLLPVELFFMIDLRCRRC